MKDVNESLKQHEHKLLEAFAKVFRRKRPPSSLRALQPFAFVLLLEAFGLAFLLDRAIVRAAILAARGQGKGDDDDLLDDSDEMVALRWAAARQEAQDRAFRSHARDVYNGSSLSAKCTFGEWLKTSHAPSRALFDQVWGERNPIDPTTTPKCFDPRAQLSILDAVSTERDGYLGVFVSDVSLRSESPPVVECMGQTLDLGACESLDMAAWRAVSKGWIAYLDHRGAVMGLRLIPRTDGIQTRLRAPLANIVSMYAPNKRDKRIAELESKLQEHEEMRNDLDRQWQDATGASDPEMARELTAQRIEQIAQLTKEKALAVSAAHLSLDRVVKDHEIVATYIDGHTTIVADNSSIDVGVSKVEVGDSTSPGIWRMVWPDKDTAPDQIACANTIAAHRRGEFCELEFPPSQKIFENVRAWLMYHQFGVRAPQPDATGYCTCAIGPGGEIPPSWLSMKESKRNAYPGFVLFAPDSSARVVFRAKETSIGKVGKRKTREAKL